MKNIIVAYWMGTAIKNIEGIEHKRTYHYSDEKRNELVDLILDTGYQIMMYEVENSLLIWIDNGRFRQR